MPTFFVSGHPGPSSFGKQWRAGDVVEQVTGDCEPGRRARTGSIFSTCSTGAKAPGWSSAFRSTGPGIAAATAEESVSVEDCARVSRDLSAVLDVEDVVPTAYTLEVSSPGLDRPLRHAADYGRFAGRRAKLVMREAVDGQMFFKGRLGGIEDGRPIGAATSS